MDWIVQIVPLGGAVHLWMNLVGAVLLTMVALIDWHMGFLVLEGAWAAISLLSLLRSQPTGCDVPEP